MSDKAMDIFDAWWASVSNEAYTEDERQAAKAGWQAAKEQYAPREAELLAKIERLEERESELVEAMRNASDHYEECELPDGGMGAIMDIDFMSAINDLIDESDAAIGDKE